VLRNKKREGSSYLIKVKESIIRQNGITIIAVCPIDGKL
jgi:hypothetical protein